MKHSLSLLLLIAASSLFLGCSSQKKPIAEVPPPPRETPAEEPQIVPSLPAPQMSEVQAAVNRIFRGAVVIDVDQAPAFVVGDFNGDLSQDIAVVLKPAPDQVGNLNDEFPRWILRDPFAAPSSRDPRLRIVAGDPLLAIIHGYGADGWRSPEATQTFLLKNAAASGIKAQPLIEFSAANQGKQLPSLHGDVIGETVAAKPGYLYFAGATYSWYDPKTFKGDDQPETAFHGRPTKVIKN